MIMQKFSIKARSIKGITKFNDYKISWHKNSISKIADL
jgi:hypothetical protein